jgi:Histidine kinase-, DNA gyrase B-, and HSP90-like ATPase
MKLIDFFSTGTIRVPWPTFIDGIKIASDRPEPTYCANHCVRQSCLEGNGTTLGKSCHIGFTYYQTQVGNSTIVCYGVVGASAKHALSAKIQRDFKDDLKGRGLAAVSFQEWIGKIRNLVILLEEEENEITSKALEPLHETPKLAKEILNLSYAIIHKQPGENFDQKFANASPEARSLYKTAGLLVDSFDMLSIFFNPKSAQSGSLSRTEPYKLIDKLSKILGGHGVTSMNPRVRLNIRGESFRAYDVYESLKVIPLTILDNAIKYSFGDAITVNIEDLPTGIGTRITITNTGPQICDDEVEHIFERSGRGKFAQAIHAQGMGVGLFVARESAKANGTKIEVTSLPKGYERNGVPVAENTFSFVVRDAPKPLDQPSVSKSGAWPPVGKEG